MILTESNNIPGTALAVIIATVVDDGDDGGLLLTRKMIRVEIAVYVKDTKRAYHCERGIRGG